MARKDLYGVDVADVLAGAFAGNLPDTGSIVKICVGDYGDDPTEGRLGCYSDDPTEGRVSTRGMVRTRGVPVNFLHKRMELFVIDENNFENINLPIGSTAISSYADYFNGYQPVITDEIHLVSRRDGQGNPTHYNIFQIKDMKISDLDGGYIFQVEAGELDFPHDPRIHSHVVTIPAFFDPDEFFDPGFFQTMTTEVAA